MIHLEGYSISFEFDNLIQMSDLIYYDGPLLSHFVSKAGDDYLFYWVMLMKSLIDGCSFVRILP